MNQLTEHEYKACQKCGMKKLRRGTDIICPNCDTSSVPSGLTTTVKDPGVGGFTKKKITGTDGKEYEIMVASDAEATQEELVELQTAPPAIATAPVQGITANDVKQHPKLLIQALRLVFEQHPARTMAEFKSLKKVRDQIDKLEFLIQNIKGE